MIAFHTRVRIVNHPFYRNQEEGRVIGMDRFFWRTEYTVELEDKLVFLPAKYLMVLPEVRLQDQILDEEMLFACIVLGMDGDEHD